MRLVTEFPEYSLAGVKAGRGLSRLVSRRARRYIAAMSASEMIDELKKLPAREQAEVLRFLHEHLRATLPAQPPAE